MKEVLEALTRRRESLVIKRPILLKLPGDITHEGMDTVLEVIAQYGLDGVIATGPTNDRSQIRRYSEQELNALGAGGVSGKGLGMKPLLAVDYLRRNGGKDLLIIGAGGVMTPTAPDFTVTLTGYQVMKFNLDDETYESASIANNSLPIIRYAEILLNYAEAKAELGEFDGDIWDRTIRPLRERAGVNGDRPSTPDPYLQTYYGISDTDILEIRRERAIELLLEGRRYDDLMRWHLGELLNKQWYGIYIPALDTSYDLNGDGINDVCVTEGAAGNETGVTYITLGGTSLYTLENGTSGRLMYNYARNFDEQRYLRPIPRTALNINPDLGQNYYWK